jgi:hypothetical protein
MWKSLQLHNLLGQCANLEKALPKAMSKGDLKRVQSITLALAQTRLRIADEQAKLAQKL